MANVYKKLNISQKLQDIVVEFAKRGLGATAIAARIRQPHGPITRMLVEQGVPKRTPEVAQAMRAKDPTIVKEFEDKIKGLV